MKGLGKSFIGILTLCMTILLHGLMAQERKVIADISDPGSIEFSPSLSGDGKTLVFQQMRKGRWYICESRLTPGGNWEKPVQIETINSRFKNISGGGVALSYDGKTLYFSAYEEQPDGVSSEDIFYSVKSGEEWGNAVNIGKPINSFRYEGSPSISADGSTLYFMRENPAYPFDNKAKVHCFSIYKSEWDGTAWKEPVQLPYPVNFNCERSPKILVDGKTLMFSSVRANSKGGFDIFQSRLRPDGEWLEPEPLNFLNTISNDQSPCISSNGEKIYYYCDGDIYEVPIPPEKREFDRIVLHGRVIDAVYKLGLSVSLEVFDHYSGTMVGKFDDTESDGKFSIDLLKGMKYVFNIVQDNFFTYTFLLDLTDFKTQSSLERDFELFSNLNLKMEIVDQKTQKPISSDKRVFIRMDGTPRQDIYMLKFEVENFNPASTFLDLSEVRKNPDFKKRIELVPL